MRLRPLSLPRTNATSRIASQVREMGRIRNTLLTVSSQRTHSHAGLLVRAYYVERGLNARLWDASWVPLQSTAACNAIRDYADWNACKTMGRRSNSETPHFQLQGWRWMVCTSAALAMRTQEQLCTVASRDAVYCLGVRWTVSALTQRQAGWDMQVVSG